MISKLIKASVAAVVLAGAGVAVWWYRKTEPHGDHEVQD